MQNIDAQFEQRLAHLTSPQVAPLLADIQHGIEREALRINADGKLAQTDHPEQLGAALTHHFITTDFSESLLEFITPPERETQKTMAQLFDIQKFVLKSMGEERLWPISMPCFIADESDIRLAQYGSSNVGRMKTLYRQGLKNRYGSMMQAIAGVHFNFSLPVNFWRPWLSLTSGMQDNQANVSDAYFGLVRNYRRICWFIPYLYGASPALCSSFLGGKEPKMPFETLGKGSIYMPNATSLRMSDLGYTNTGQASLNICYNSIDAYVSSLRNAINSPSAEFERFAGKVNGDYQQLNSNILQIENELYSPIRPKQPTRSLEKPTDALADRGVSYVEVRALDVNPFSPVGIDVEQVHFLDLFLLHCLVTPGAQMTEQDYRESEENINTTVAYGREKGVKLQRSGVEITLTNWANELLVQMQGLAEVMDNVKQTNAYSNALNGAKAMVDSSDLTLSGQYLERLRENNMDNGDFALQLAEQHRRTFLQDDYQIHDDEFFKKQAVLSRQLQSQMEANDKVDFDTFLRQQFGG